MSSIKNKVILIGHLGTDPEITNFESGKSVAQFSLATNEKFKNAKGETVEDTQWHNIVVWGNRANIVEKYLKKGSEVCVEGKLTHRTYVKDDVKFRITEVKVEELVMFGGKPGAETPLAPLKEQA